MEKIYTKNAPEAVGPYSQAIMVGNTLYTSGQIGLDPKTGTLVDGIEAQAVQVFNNLNEVLKASNMTFDNVVKTTVFIKNMSDFAKVNEIYAKYFTSLPARSCVEVSSLPKGALIEVELVAIK